ncbi:MAG: hypothetical protein ACXVB9_11015 [Bdellovibrionota bacterium]
MKTFSRILPFLFISLPAFAQGSADLFVRPGLSERIIFQDLSGPIVPTAESEGDRIILPAGEAGAWTDFRALDSFRFLQQRLTAWSPSAPRFAALMRATALRQPDWIATSYSIQYGASAKLPGEAIAGAYLSKDHLFVDVKVWNRAGLQSQAALILHEMLRANQERLQLSDGFLRRIVFRVIEEEPFSGNLFGDEAFGPDLDASDIRPAHAASPKEEVDAAVTWGILGGETGHAPVSPCYHGPGNNPDGGSDAGHSGGEGCELPRQ